MYIKPISKLSLTGDIVSANRQRRLEVSKVIDDRNLVNRIFYKLESGLENSNNNKIQNILSYELFFEIIPQECITTLLLTYSKLDVNSKECYMNLLKESYIIRGAKGFIFSFIPIINMF